MAEPKYDAILNYSKFYEFINRNKMHLKDSRYLVDDEDVDIEEELTLYTDIEITNAPHDAWNECNETDLIQIGRSHSTWNFRYETDGTKYEITLEPSYDDSTLLDNARIADGFVFAINHRDPTKLLLFKKGTPDSNGKVKFWHEKVCNPRLGFLNDDGNILLRFQLQILPAAIQEISSQHSLHSFHRQFRIQLYWIRKQLIDNSFSNMFETSNHKYESVKYSCSPGYWIRYLIDSGQELRVNKVRFWGCLSKHCEGQYGLIDIICNGMKSELSSSLIQDDETYYHLSGPLGGFISKVGNLRYAPILENTGTLTLDGVLEFEKELVTLGWNMFACTFLKLTLPDNFLNFQKEFPEQQISGGSAVIGPAPAESNVPVIPETVPDRDSAAYVANLEIQKLCKDLETNLVALGTKLRADVVTIGKQYGQTHDFSIMYANLFETVQAFALKELSPGVDSGRIADHMFDMQNQYFRPISKTKTLKN